MRILWIWIPNTAGNDSPASAVGGGGGGGGPSTLRFTDVSNWEVLRTLVHLQRGVTPVYGEKKHTVQFFIPVRTTPDPRIPKTFFGWTARRRKSSLNIFRCHLCTVLFRCFLLLHSKSWAFFFFNWACLFVNTQETVLIPIWNAVICQNIMVRTSVPDP